MEKLMLDKIFSSLMESDFYIHSPARKESERVILKKKHAMKNSMPENEYEQLEYEISSIQLLSEQCGFLLGFKYAVNLLCECANHI